jgi:hypothetical protein
MTTRTKKGKGAQLCCPERPKSSMLNQPIKWWLTLFLVPSRSEIPNMSSRNAECLELLSRWLGLQATNKALVSLLRKKGDVEVGDFRPVSLVPGIFDSCQSFHQADVQIKSKQFSSVITAPSLSKFMHVFFLKLSTDVMSLLFLGELRSSSQQLPKPNSFEHRVPSS